MERQGSLSEGTLALSVQFIASEQKDRPVLISRLPLTDGILEVCTFEDQIAARLMRAENGQLTQIDLWISPHLKRNEHRYLTVVVMWQNERLTYFSLDRTDLTRASEEETLDLWRDSTIDPLAEGEVASPISGTAELKALDTNRIRNLRQCVERLGWALDELTPDRPGAALNVAALLRMLITGKSNALLFGVARDLGLSVWCYASEASSSNGRNLKAPIIGAIAIEQVASATPNQVQKVRVAFEEWLTWPSVLRTESYIAHWQIIRLISDKVSVHADRDGLTELGVFLNTHHPGVDLGALVQLMRDYGRLTLEIALALLAAIDKG